MDLRLDYYFHHFWAYPFASWNATELWAKFDSSHKICQTHLHLWRKYRIEPRRTCLSTIYICLKLSTSFSWWGQSKRPHSNLGRCRCVLFGTGSHMAIPSANKAYLDALSSATKLVTQIGNHTQTVWPSFARFSTWVPRFEITRRCVKLMFTVCVALWKSAATAHFCARRTFLTIATCGNGSVPDSTG